MARKPTKFTNSEIGIIPLLVQGNSTREIATKLGIGQKVISKHRDNLRRKNPFARISAKIVRSIIRARFFDPFADLYNGLLCLLVRLLLLEPSFHLLNSLSVRVLM